MSTSRRSFIKHGVSAASVGLLSGAIAAPSCGGPSLPADPDIRILLSGLLLYRFNGTTNCDVDIPKDNDGSPHSDHLFSIVVKAREGTKPPYTLWRHFHDLENLVLDGDGMNEGVSKYTPTTGSFLREARNDDSDWKWMLRLNEFHDPEPHINDSNVFKVLQVRNGLFYTALRTNRDRTRVAFTRGGSTDEYPLHTVGSAVGANIYLRRGGSASLRGSGINLEMPKGDDVRYEIYFEYDPPAPDQPSEDGTPSHFYDYYYAMYPQPAEPCQVFYYDIRPQHVREREKATPDVPCMGLEAGG
ncbi:MAG: hypothetical protein AABN34_12565 [Acidobacteriota bacterium]